MELEKISNRLNELLRMSGDSRREMARKSGISATTISRYISGIQEPSSGRAGDIATAYGVSPAWVLGFDVPMYLEKQSNAELEQSAKKRLLLYQNLLNADALEVLLKYSALSEKEKTAVKELIEKLGGD